MSNIYFREKTDVLKAGLEVCNFIRKEILAQVFSCEFYEISQNTFFTEQLWTTSSEIH